MFSTIRAALVGALALALLVPAAANAKPYPVSRDVGVYTSPDLKNGVGVVKAHETVDVQCWRYGQSVGGYNVWDQIKRNGGTYYVHDKYVEMGGSPQSNGIQQCGKKPPSQGQPAPGQCIAGDWKQYLAYIEKSLPDKWGSMYRFKWSIRFCPRAGGGYTVEGKPDVREFANWVTALGELQLGEAEINSNGDTVTYRPRWRICPVKVIDIDVCATGANMRVIARVTGNKVRFDRVVHTLGPGSTRIGGWVGWRHKQDQN
jgi:hypothetical protein